MLLQQHKWIKTYITLLQQCWDSFFETLRREKWMNKNNMSEDVMELLQEKYLWVSITEERESLGNCDFNITSLIQKFSD
jgi:leucyl aminopeptidase (aminopeptidase T)